MSGSYMTYKRNGVTFEFANAPDGFVDAGNTHVFVRRGVFTLSITLR